MALIWRGLGPPNSGLIKIRTSDRPPVASIVVDTVQVETITFNISGSSDDYGITEYIIDYGDGTSGTDLTHTYPAQDTEYTATLTVTDRVGSANTSTVVFSTGVVPAPSDYQNATTLNATGYTMTNPAQAFQDVEYVDNPYLLETSLTISGDNIMSNPTQAFQDVEYVDNAYLLETSLTISSDYVMPNPTTAEEQL